MRFSYFSYNQDQDDQEKVPSFSPSDYNHVDERRDKLGIDFFKLNPFVHSLYKEECFKTLNMHHHHHDEDDNDDDDDNEEEEPRKIEWEYLEELVAELLDEFELSMDKSIMMDSGQCSSVIKVQEYDDNDDDLDHYNNTGDFKIIMYGLFEVYDDDDLEHYYDIKELAGAFKVDIHGVPEVYDDEDLEHHYDIKELAGDFKVDMHGLPEVQLDHAEEQI